MPTNFYMYFITALIPLLIGSVYYHPKVVGTAWMNANRFTEEDLKGANMIAILGLSYLLGVMISFAFGGVVIHQTGTAQMMIPEMLESGSEAQAVFNNLMATYGDHHRSFGHGAIHGILFTILFVLPIIAINALFERRGGKYIFIHFFYWIITLVLIGGVLCQTLHWAPAI